MQSQVCIYVLYFPHTLSYKSPHIYIHTRTHKHISHTLSDHKSDHRHVRLRAPPTLHLRPVENASGVVVEQGMGPCSPHCLLLWRMYLLQDIRYPLCHHIASLAL
jgi:hypothetical protein